MYCDSANFREDDLKRICAHLMHTDQFDEELFAEEIEKLIIQPNGDVQMLWKSGQSRTWQNLHLKESVKTVTDCFQGKILCSCGDRYHRRNAKKYCFWYCMSRRDHTCDHIIYTDSQLRKICAYMMGEDFTEERFTERIETITALDGGNLQFKFKDGSEKIWQNVLLQYRQHEIKSRK